MEDVPPYSPAEYWHAIREAAERERMRQRDDFMLIAVIMVTCGAVIGLNLLPNLLGALIGFGIGGLILLCTVMCTSKTQASLAHYQELLNMTETAGLTYATALYRQFGRELSSDELMHYIVSIQWEDASV